MTQRSPIASEAAQAPPTRSPRGASPSVDPAYASLTLIAAPPGWGKTLLMGAWFEEEQRLGREPLWVGSVRDAPSRRFVLDHLIDDAATAARDSTVFVDDVHALPDDDVADLIERFVDVGPSRWRLVLAGRRTMHTPIRHGDAVSVRQLGPHDLALDAERVTHMISRALGEPVDRATISQLTERIGGWGAAAQLCAHIAAHSLDPAAALERLSRGDRDRDLAAYLEQEVLGELNESDRRFLLGSATLPVPTPEACDALVATGDAQERLTRLARAHAGLATSVDGSIQWMPLVRSHLLGLLEASDPPAVRDRRRSAIDWYRRSGDHRSAITLAVEAEDWEQVCDLLLEHGLRIVASRDRDVVLWALASMPNTVLERESGVAIVGAIAEWARGGDASAASVDDWLATAEAHRRGAAPCDAAGLRSAIDAARSMFAPLEADERIRLARRALESERGTGSPWEVLGLVALGITEYFAGHPDRAREPLRRAVEIFGPHANEPSWCDALARDLALGALALMDLEAGDHHHAGVLVSTGKISGPGLDGPGLLDVARARIALAAGDRRTAVAHLDAISDDSSSSHVRSLASLDLAVVVSEVGPTERSSEAVEDARSALSQVVGGSAHLDRQLAAIERRLEREIAAEATPHDALSERERAVLELLDSDLSRREIAARLYLSHNTVKTYIQRLYRRLDVSSRPAALTKARALGWL